MHDLRCYFKTRLTKLPSLVNCTSVSHRLFVFTDKNILFKCDVIRFSYSAAYIRHFITYYEWCEVGDSFVIWWIDVAVVRSELLKFLLADRSPIRLRPSFWVDRGLLSGTFLIIFNNLFESHLFLALLLWLAN